MKETRLNGCVYDFSVYYRAFDTSSNTNIHKYLMEKHDLMFGIINKMLIVLSASIVNASNHTICVSLNNQKC